MEVKRLHQTTTFPVSGQDFFVRLYYFFLLFLLLVHGFQDQTDHFADTFVNTGAVKGTNLCVLQTISHAPKDHHFSVGKGRILGFNDGIQVRVVRCPKCISKSI